MRKMLLSMLAAALLLGAAAQSPAQTESKHLLTVSFAGYDKIMDSIGMFGRLAGDPDTRSGLEFMLRLKTQGNGLAGLDKTRPWGSITTIDGQQTTAYTFIPITDLKQLVDTARKNPRFAEAIKLNNGIYEIDVKDQTVYAQEKGKWLVITDNRDRLAAAPADPMKFLGNLPKDYDIALRLSAKNLPPEYRQQTLAMLRAIVEMSLMRFVGGGDDDYTTLANSVKQAFGKINDVVKDLDEVMLGWNVDTSATTTHLDLELTAKNGTRLADRFALIKPGKTNFDCFAMPEAALTANWVGSLSDADVTEAKDALASYRKMAMTRLADQGFSEDELKVAKKLVNEVFDVIEKTIEAKKNDGGVALLLGPKAITFLGGRAIVDAPKLEKALKQLVDELQKTDPKLAKWFKLDADTYQGVRFHLISTPMPKEELKPFVGERLDVVLGIADDKLLFAVGRDAAEKLKKAIDRSKASAGKEVLPLRISLAATQMAKFAAALNEDDTNAAALAAALEKANGKDHLQITTRPIPHGIRVRLEIESGLLKAICSVGKDLAPKGMMPPAAPAGQVPPPAPPRDR